MKENFKAEAESLKEYQVPEWFRDAKFGIFIHYGIYAVPAFGDEWYGHWMYIKDSKAWGGADIFNHHKDTYGGYQKRGYVDFVPEFLDGLERFSKGKKAWDWATLFEEAGAKYVMPVGIHHDAFALYDSDVQLTYNSVKQANIDYIGELKHAIKEHGMHFGVSNHFAENRWFFAKEASKESDVWNEELNEMYGAYNTLDGHVQKWYDISMEIIEKYHPELIYYDFDLKNPEYIPVKRKMLANYYNMAETWDENAGVICNYKQEAFEDGEAMLEVERGSLSEIREMPWQTCTSIGAKSWGYVEDEVYRDSREMLCALVDIVSKNGNLLLNVGPRADGTIPKEAQKTLLEMGKWLKENGRAIYGSRPWITYGEGPNSHKAKGEFSDDFKYTAEDFRFTASKDGKRVYLFVMDAPKATTVCVKSLKSCAKQINEIKLMNGEILEWKEQIKDVVIYLPETTWMRKIGVIEITLQ
jgi:alpha-L-fucosidase